MAAEDGDAIGRMSPEATKIWSTLGPNSAVAFDVDLTVTSEDSIDALAKFMGKSDSVAAITDKAMNGDMTLEQALEERMRIINPSPQNVQQYLEATPPSARLNPGAKRLIKALHQRGIAVYLISGGFREMVLPVAAELGIPYSRVYANRMLFTADDSTGLPTQFSGYDPNQPTSHAGGKPEVIRALRERHPYDAVVMVGDGITDLEAAQLEGGADCFIAYAGCTLRPAVAAEADGLVAHFDALYDQLARLKVAFVGSGAWACAAVKLAAANAEARDRFESEIRMWVYEEELEGGLLSEMINRSGENPKVRQSPSSFVRDVTIVPGQATNRETDALHSPFISPSTSKPTPPAHTTTMITTTSICRVCRWAIT